MTATPGAAYSAEVQWANTLAGINGAGSGEDTFSKFIGAASVTWSITRVARANMPIPSVALFGVQGAPTSSAHLATVNVNGCQIGYQTLSVGLTGVRWPWRSPLVTLDIGL